MKRTKVVAVVAAALLGLGGLGACASGSNEQEDPLKATKTCSEWVEWFIEKDMFPAEKEDMGQAVLCEYDGAPKGEMTFYEMKNHVEQRTVDLERGYVEDEDGPYEERYEQYDY